MQLQIEKNGGDFEKKEKSFEALFQKKCTLLLDKISSMAHFQRYTIAQMKNNGFTRKEICLVIGKDKSVLSRELQRNSDKRNGVYKVEHKENKWLSYF